MPKARVVVIVANLGTPDAPTPRAVRRFLKQFLSDGRVIEIPKLLWWVILRAFVLPFRPQRVAEAYAKVWTEDSPMRKILYQQVAALQQGLSAAQHEFDLQLIAAMRYGQPSLDDALEQAKGCDHLIVLPLFPQYSATSTAPIYDVLARWVLQQRNLPGLSVIRDYYQHPLYIEALAQRVLQFQQQHGVADKLLMSFHGIPQPYADRGDPYAERCHRTAEAVAQRLNLAPTQWAISFQSRFGRQEWVKPYTDVLLQQWAAEGVKRVQIMSPAFSADCLETLEELALQNAELFLHAGGEDYAYIPALNTDPAHIALLSQLLQAQLDTLKLTLAQS